MSERLSKVLLIAEALLLLLPLTLLAAFFVLVSYSAYPPPSLRPIQIAFDLALALTIAALVAAWRLAVLHLRVGGALRKAHRAWFALLVLGALIGAASLLVVVQRVLSSGAPGEYVGFALLTPAAVLGVLAIHLLLEARRADDHKRAA